MMRRPKLIFSLFLIIAAAIPLSASVGTGSAAAAATPCSFVTAGSTMTLQANCRTRTTIKVPSGDTLNGKGHKITAVDPTGGLFKGAVIANAGTKATVEHVTVVGDFTNTNPQCKSFLAGISISNAKANIKDTKVEDINRGASSTCGDGDGIDVSNSNATAVKATVTDNTVSNFASAGISLNGNVTGSVGGNVLTAYSDSASPFSCYAITTGSGAQVNIIDNQITDDCTNTSTPCNGISLYTGGAQNTVTNNTVDGTCTSDVYTTNGILMWETSGAVVEDNTVDFSGSSSTGIGVWDEGSSAPANNNNISNNTVLDSLFGVTVVSQYESDTAIAPDANNNGVQSNAIDDPSSGEDGVYIYECSGQAQPCSTDATTVGANTITCYGTDVLDEGTGTNNDGNTDNPCPSLANNKRAGNRQSPRLSEPGPTLTSR